METICTVCGSKFEAQDLSAFFDGPVEMTCDECYQDIQAKGREAARKVSEASDDFLNSND